MNNMCRDCMLDKHLNRYPEGTPDEIECAGVCLARERWIIQRSSVILMR